MRFMHRNPRHYGVRHALASRALRLLVTIMALIASGGCDVEPTAPTESDLTRAEEAAADLAMPVSAAAVSYSQEYTWNGGGAVLMGSTAGRVCFLTRVGGDFDSSQDFVRVAALFGVWYITGGSSASSSGVSARARCANVNAYTPNEFVATSTGTIVKVPLPASTELRACGLTGVRGRFNSQHHIAEVYPSGQSPWFEDRTLVAAAGRGGYVEVRVRCATENVGWHSPFWYWNQSNPLTQLTGAANFCFLAGIRGALEGNTEWVGVFPIYYTSPVYWWLGGGSQQSGVGGRAGCMQELTL